MTLDSATVKFLFKHKANPNVYDLQDNTPLHIACSNKRQAMIRLLIQNGSNVDAKNVADESVWEIVKDENEQNEIKQIIDKCVNEVAELQQLKKDKKLPFNDENVVMNIVTQIDLDTSVDELLNIIIHDPSVTPLLELELEHVNSQDVDETDNEAQNTQIDEQITNWTNSFNTINIHTFEQLSTAKSENWPLLVDIPIPVIYCLEKLCDLHQRS